MTLARERRVRGVIKAQRFGKKYGKVRSVCEIRERTVRAMDPQTKKYVPFYTKRDQR